MSFVENENLYKAEDFAELMGRPEEYEALQARDVRKAFRQAYDEIELAQEALRRKDPESPLLGLVVLSPNREGLKFSRSFKPVVMEHSDFPETTNLYFALGWYVDLLTKELREPLYSQTI